MKKIITISALALLLVFVSCSDKKETPTEKAEQTETTETATQETTAREQTEESNKTVIKLNLKKGDTYSITMKKDEKISMELEGENKWGKQLSEMTYNFLVDDVDESGNITAKIKITRIKKTIESSEGDAQSFDSEKSGKTDDTPDTQSLKSIVGKQYSFTITPFGQVIEVKGTEKMIKSILKGIDLDEKILKVIEMGLRQEFGPEQIIAFYEKLFNYLNEQPRKVGDKWQKVYDINAGINLKATTNYVIDKITDDKIYIKMNSKLKNPAGKQRRENEQVILTSEVNGEQSGDIIVDRNTGFFIKNKVKQVIRAKETQEEKESKKTMTLKTTKTSTYTITTVKK
jgi:hypothetical protein